MIFAPILDWRRKQHKNVKKRTNYIQCTKRKRSLHTSQLQHTHDEHQRVLYMEQEKKAQYCNTQGEARCKPHCSNIHARMLL